MCGNGGGEGDVSSDGRGTFLSPGIWWLWSKGPYQGWWEMALGQEAGSQCMEGSEHQSEISDLILGNGRVLRDSAGGQDNKDPLPPKANGTSFQQEISKVRPRERGALPERVGGSP